MSVDDVEVWVEVTWIDVVVVKLGVDEAFSEVDELKIEDVVDSVVSFVVEGQAVVEFPSLHSSMLGYGGPMSKSQFLRPESKSSQSLKS